MSTFLLDTNIWIGLSKGDPVLDARIEGLPQHQIASCSVVRAELLFGAYKSRKVEANLKGIDKLLGPFVSFPFDDESAAHYGVLRSELEKAGAPISANDMMIAAIALAHDCVLVTRNIREFQRVPGLRIERW